MKTDATGRSRVSTNTLIAWSVGFAILFLIAISIVASSSNPDPTDVAPGSQSLATSITNASVIVFREGLEAVLIFAAITASFLGTRQQYRRPVTMGVAAAFGATVVTWFVMTAALGALPVSEDVLLAITGIAAVVILLLVMNWFFHKVYWTDHIKELNARKRELVDASEAGGSVRYWGFFALGFTAVYREGFEVVLFLQNLHIVAGTAAVMWGVLVGLAGTVVVGFLTFFAHHRLPYRRMLVLTGVLLGIVLVVMIGGSARTMQALGILSTTPLPFDTPDWWARWFEIVPTWETVIIQLLAAAFVMGSYYAAEWWAREKRRRARIAAPIAPVDVIAPPEVAAPTAATSASAPAPVSAPAASGRFPAPTFASSARTSTPSPSPSPAPALEHPTAARVFAATAALPELAWRAPYIASAPAAVREVERVQAGRDVSRTLCGHPAVTLCGCDATVPIAAASMRPSGAAAPPTPTTTAPAFTPRPLFVDRPAAFVRAPLFAPRVSDATPAQ